MITETTQHRGEISIQQVLADIREHTGRTFFLQFVRATGKKKGTIKTVAKAVYGAPKRALATDRDANGGNDRKKPLHIERGTLPITNTDNGEYNTPLIATFITYNGYKIIH